MARSQESERRGDPAGSQALSIRRSRTGAANLLRGHPASDLDGIRAPAGYNAKAASNWVGNKTSHSLRRLSAHRMPRPRREPAQKGNESVRVGGAARMRVKISAAHAPTPRSSACDQSLPQRPRILYESGVLNVADEGLRMFLHQRAHILHCLSLRGCLDVPGVFETNAVQHGNEGKEIECAGLLRSSQAAARRRAAVKVETRKFDLDGEHGVLTLSGCELGGKHKQISETRPNNRHNKNMGA